MLSCKLPDETLTASDALDHAFDLVAIVGLPDLRLYALNRPGRSLLNVGPTELLPGPAWCGCFAPKTWEALTRHAVAAARAGRPWRGAGTLRCCRGREVPVRLVLWSAAGDRAVLAAIDDSATYNMQAVLRNEQMLLHAVLNTVPDAIFFKDRESHFVRGNPALARKMGVAAPGDMVGHTDFDYFGDEHARQAFADEQRIMATGLAQVDVEEKETWPDGRVTWVSTSRFPLRNAIGEIIGTFGISRDITARKHAEQARRQLESQLLLAQKMESIGRLAAGVAHEINTPMQFITDNAHFLVGAFRQLSQVLDVAHGLRDQARTHADLAVVLQALGESEAAVELDYLRAEIPRTLQQSLDGLGRVTRIVQSMRELSHPGTAERIPINLNQVVQTVMDVSRHEWKQVATVVTELDRDLPEVPGVQDEINQAILNLVVNAAHAIGDALVGRPGDVGRITLRTRRHESWAVIEVEDTGTGIPERARPHIFEPFFTTKAAGRGTGQGLALVHTVIVKHHEGLIDFTTEPGRGTTFRVHLPFAPAPVLPAAEAAWQPDSPNSLSP